MPNSPLSQRLEVGWMTTVQLPLSKHKLFVKRLLKATGGALSLSELALEDGASSVYVIPQPVEQAVRSAKGWQDEADWTAGLQDWGALAVNVLDAETVFRLIDIGRVKAAVTQPSHRVPTRGEKSATRGHGSPNQNPAVPVSRALRLAFAGLQGAAGVGPVCRISRP